MSGGHTRPSKLKVATCEHVEEVTWNPIYPQIVVFGGYVDFAAGESK